MKRQGQNERLEQIFQMLGKPRPSDAIEGLLDEGEEIMDEYKSTSALDAGLLAVASGRALWDFTLWYAQTWAGNLDHAWCGPATLTEEENR